MNAFLLSALSAIVLLLAASGTFVLSKRFHFPYTVALVAIGLGVGAVSMTFPAIGFLDDFRLTPEVLLYVFLPILLFESAYNIGYKELLSNVRSVASLAVVSLVVSALVIGFGLQFVLGLFGIEIPLVVALLFWTLISATDPVAVLALFKELGAPKRLTLIFEGESLFNDGTALALFLVVLSVVAEMSGASEAAHESFFSSVTHLLGLGTFSTWAWSFLSMIAFGMLFWGFVGVAFSKIIGKLKNEPFLELALTLVLAHATFLAAEVLSHFVVPTSGVIATTIAAMVVGNYGRLKISPSVEKVMGHYWEFFAFLANSFVFILIGIMFVELRIDWQYFLLPSALAVAVVMIARAASIYPVVAILNATKWEERIPLSWQHLLSWGSLRGALAVIMVLLIPETLTVPGWNLPMPIRDFVLALTVGCIVFTTFVKATTIFPLMKKFDLAGFGETERVEYLKGRLRILLDARSKLDRMEKEGRIPEEESSLLRTKHERELEETETLLKELLQKNPEGLATLLYVIVSRHALGLEKFWLKELYAYNEIPEGTLKILLRKITRQIERLEAGKSVLRSGDETPGDNAFEKFADFLDTIAEPKGNPAVSEYVKARARDIVCERVVRDIAELESIGFLSESGAVAEVKSRYESFGTKAREIRASLYKKHKDILLPLDSRLADKALLLTKNRVLDELVEKSVLPQKVSSKLREEIETELFAKII